MGPSTKLLRFSFFLLFEVKVLCILAMVDYGMYYSGNVDVETTSAQIMELNLLR